ncbi:Serine/threonine protein kinase, partial [Globisporangium splendens]
MGFGARLVRAENIDAFCFGARVAWNQHYEVKLEVFGDNQMIIAPQNGFSSIRQTKLQPLAVRVNQVIANFARTSWNRTKREQNKMADLLANMAMNSKNAKILTDESRGNDQVVMSQVAALLDNGVGATPSKLRNTSLSAVFMRLRNSSTELHLGTWKNTAATTKRMSYEGDKEKVSTQLFLREVRIWHQLSHPHVIKLFGVCHDGKRFFASECARNGILNDALKLDGQQSKPWM